MSDLARLLQLMRPFWRRALLALLLSAATIGSSIALMMTAAWLISSAALQMGIVSLGLAPTAVRFFGLSRAVFRYLERLVTHDVTLRLLARLRVSFYSRLEPLALTQLQVFRSGDLMARLAADIDELEDFYTRVIGPPLVAVLVTGGVGLIFGRIDKPTALVAVGFMVAAGTVLPLLTAWRGAGAGRQVVESRARLSQHLVDTIHGLADSTAFGTIGVMRTALSELSHALAERERHLGWLDGLENGVSLLLVNLAAAAVLWTALDRIDGIMLAAVTLGTIAAFEAITPLAAAGRSLGRQRAAARRVLSILAAAPSIPAPAHPATLPGDAPDLQLDDVTLRYQDDAQPVWRGFSLAAPFGSHILLTGPSGVGKSSLINVLLRLAAYEGGSIALGGVDLRTLAHNEVRGCFAVMSQQTYLFNTTIRENIRLGTPSASEEAVVAAARAAQIDAFIHALPDGYDTRVGESGGLLSGGERQRIALARMLLKDAPIWLLDEVTANLDPVTAVSVMRTVLAAGAERTLIVMTHRPQLVAGHHFDQRIRLADES